MMMFAFTCTCYWQLMPSMIYDTCEVDELYNGKRREGIISSAQCFIEAISAAVGMQALGLILKFAGFNGEAAVQSANALTVDRKLDDLAAGHIHCPVNDHDNPLSAD